MNLKKCVSLLLALVMSLSLALPAAAMDEDFDSETYESVDVNSDESTEASIEASTDAIVTAVEEPVEVEETSVPFAMFAAAASVTTPLGAIGKDGGDIDYSKDGAKGWSKWQNVIFLGGATEGSTDKEVSAWHLVINGEWEESGISSISITFEHNSYTWNSADGFSTNGGGKNPGLMLVAPASWGAITAGSITGVGVNKFVISGYYKAGTPTTPGGGDEGKTSTEFTFYKYVDEIGTQPTEAFTFEVWALNGAGTADDAKVDVTVTTEDNFTYGFKGEKLPEGSYEIREVLVGEQAERYEAGKTLGFTVDADGVATGDSDMPYILNELKPQLFPVVFDVTKAIVGGGTLAGFQFAIFDGDTQVATATTNDAGQASFDTKLAVGTYTIKEIGLDTDNYVANTQEFTVVVAENGDVTVNGGEAVTFTNNRLVPIDVTVNKTVVGDDNLAGFTFGLFNTENEKLAEVTTTATGTVTFNTKVVAGTYTIKEIDQNTNDYETNSESFTVVVANDGTVTVTGQETKTVTFTNKKLTEFDMTKHVDGAASDVAFTFEVQGLEADEYTVTGPVNGTYTFKFTKNLAAGEYTIVEKLTDAQKTDYVDGKTLSFTVDANGVATVANEGVFENETRTKFQFNKYLNEVGATTDDTFNFVVKDAEGNTVAADMTIDGSTYKFNCEQHLANGTYTIEEVLRDDQDGKYVTGKTLTVTVADGVATVANEGNFVNDNHGELDVTGNAIKAWYEEYHKLVYKFYNYGTLVAGINPKTGNLALPAGMTGSYLKNGMTYLTINKSVFEGGKEIELNIAQSNMTGGGKKGNTDKWNTPVVGGKTFTLSLNAKGQLVVNSGLTADESTFGARVYSAGATVKGPQDIKHNNQTTYDLPKGDTFKFFIHWENTSYTLGEIIGCELDYQVPKFEEIDSDVIVSVTDAAGTEVATGTLASFTKAALEAGKYTVTLTFEDEVIGTKDVTVRAGETVTADFGKVTVQGENVVAFCPYVPTYGKEHGIFPNNPIMP